MSASAPARRPTIQPIRPNAVLRAPVGVAGQLLGGKYRLERRIATGGMASVWRALHVTLDRPVAVKFVDAVNTDGDDARIDRFLREAKVAASVRHKNVVDILDFGVFEDAGAFEPYMIMELLEGEPLDRLLVHGALPTPIAVDIARQVLSGLDAVHRAGIVHRDVKPGNVFLSDDADGYFARVLDFGISQDTEVASDGTVVGTPEYMSPEQAYAEPLDFRSDLYSVGVILYEMLSGVLPFDDPSPLTVIQMVAAGNARPLIELRPDAPALCRVVATAMSKRPEERFENAREMQRALADAMGLADVTGRHAVLTDRHVSGAYRREAPTMDPAEGAEPRTSERPIVRAESERPAVRAESVRPAAPVETTRRAPVIGIAIVVAIVIALALAWRFGGATQEAAPVASTPTVTAPVVVAAPPVAPPPEAPVVAEVAPPPTSVVIEAPVDAVEPEPEPIAPPPTTHARRPTRAHAQGSIVRELDF